MYNSNIYFNEDGFLVAHTEYKGLIAFYLKWNRVTIEKKWYKSQNKHVFKEKLRSGIISVVFFFKDNDGVITKYETDNYSYNSEKMLLVNIKGVILREEKDYRITYYDRGSNITFITFNGTKTTKETLPFGLNFIMLNSWNLISVAQDNDTQYQGLSLEDFHEVVSPVVNDKEVYAYGASLGGYCALYFGGCVNATIIAGAPKNSAHPSINAPRFKNLTFTHQEFNFIPITNKQVYIVYDSTIKSDSIFIADYVSLAYSSPNLLDIKNGTHMILQTMLEAGILRLYVDSIVKGYYSEDISSYIKAKCKFYQRKYKESFEILEDIIKGKINL